MFKIVPKKRSFTNFFLSSFIMIQLDKKQHIVGRARHSKPLVKAALFFGEFTWATTRTQGACHHLDARQRKRGKALVALL